MLVGTSHHEFLPALPAVVNNLTALREALCSQDIWGLPPQYCATVCDPTDSTQMLDPVRNASREATDTLILYFAGHGLTNQRGELYLSLCKSEEQKPYSAVKYEDVRDQLVDSRATRRIVILDCCFSGLALGSMAGEISAVVNEASIEGTYILAAAPENRIALARPGEEYTAFTGELLNVVQGGLAGKPELLTLDTIFNHVRDVMCEKSLPVPQKRDRNTAGQLTLVKNRASRRERHGPGYGSFSGIAAGTVFPSRHDLHKAGIHRPLQAGICGTADQGGAESIVVSGGYKDDKDYGDVIIYTGHGGRDPNTGAQIKDQDPTDPGNAALLRNILTGVPVRVIRGASGDPKYSPPSGYSYDGLFSVEQYWSTPGIDGPRILQFRLEQIDDESTSAREGPQARTGQPQSNRRGGPAPNQWERVASGVYRDRRISERVIEAHDSECQICGTFLEAPGGRRYARAVHIRGLSVPHEGPDVPENILCLCPNHSVLFELGSFTMNDDLEIIDEVSKEIVGDLRTNKKHRVGVDYIRYHRNLYRF
nr:YDG/SRA domain-containing protein [Actinoallomurus bryophytorum]